MALVCIFYQQQVDAGQILGLFAEMVYDYPFVPAKGIKSEVVLILHFGDLRDWGIWLLIPSKLSPSCVGYLIDLAT